MEMKAEQMITEDDELIVPMSIEYREDLTVDDFKELCRLCGNISKELMAIFVGEGLEHNLPDKIKEYLPVNVSIDDDLPLNICYQCASTLISWHELYCGTKEVDKRLREISSRALEIKENNDNLEDTLKDRYDEYIAGTLFGPINDAPAREESDIPDQNVVVGTVALPIEDDDRCTPLNSNVLSVSSSKFRITTSQVSHAPNYHNSSADESEVTSPGSLSTEFDPRSTDDVQTLIPVSSSNEISVTGGSQASELIDTEFDSIYERETLLSVEQLKKRTCDNCGRKFLNSVNFTVHLNELHIIHANLRLFQTLKPPEKMVENEFECYFCHETFEQLSELNAHITKEHVQEKKLQCDICHWRYETVCDLAMHRSVHTLNEKLICRFCGGRCRVSVRRRYEDVPNLVACQCSLNSDSSLPTSQPKSPLVEPKLRPSARLSVTKPVITKVDVGDSCQKSDEWWDQSKKHLPSVRRIQNVHLTRCEFCEMECGSYYNLKRHKRTHNKRVYCVICNKLYLKHYLKTHMLIHDSKKTFACDKCGKSFTQKSSLRAHQLLEENEKRFMCNICGEQFVLSSRMQWHMKSHMAVKPYKCVDCNKEFGYVWQLNQHRVAHSKERKFVCECCAKTYKTMKHLKQHWNRHPTHRK